MFFSLTDEQRALQATVREFLADRFPLTSVRALYDEPDGDGDPSELWKAVGEQGWLAVTIDEQYDGLGLGLLRRGRPGRACGWRGAGPRPARGCRARPMLGRGMCARAVPADTRGRGGHPPGRLTRSEAGV